MDIEIYGAREHNLKNIDVTIPRHALTVITGMSGSGKSSLAFDTLYTEGQRRYIDTFGTYARGFLGGGMERPDVEEITGLGPVVSIEQKTTNRNPRSTVGTVTDVYDFFRLLFARAGTAYSWASGEAMIKYTEEQIVDLCLEHYIGKKVLILSPIVRDRKGHYKELFERLRKKGYLTVRIDGELREIKLGMKLDRYKQHSIEVQIDKLKIRGEEDKERLSSTITLALKEGDGLLMVLDVDTNQIRYYSRSLMCPTSGIAYKDPAPHNFSFNSPQGWCPRCKGLGEVVVADRSKLINPELSIIDGGITLIGKSKKSFILYLMGQLCEKYNTTLQTPMKDLPAEMIDEILNGTEEYHELSGNPTSPLEELPGLVKLIEDKLANGSTSAKMKRTLQDYLHTEPCPHCHGMRLNREALQFRLAGKNIGQINHLSIDELVEWIDGLDKELDSRQIKIASEIIKEIKGRLVFLQDVGLGYLSLDRASATLSGGESQRIRLATQIGTQLVEVVYILDEPSIGLHQRDNDKLIHSLEKLRDIGNTVIVVEHDREMMEHADHLIDMGPGAGRKGGHVVFEGSPKDIAKSNGLTADYLSGKRNIDVPKTRRKGNGKELILLGAEGNNLKKIDVHFPLGTFICVTGVSGSGKSTLINDTLYPILSQNLYNSIQNPLKYSELKGIEFVDKVIAVDQSPIGKTPRSNPATYSGVFTDIRTLFEATPESRARGYKIGRFSFNVAGGRCEECKGNGYKTIEMNFLPDVLAPCQSCGGKRYNRETLEIRYKGKSIADVLDMTINMAIDFFDQVPHIKRKLKAMQDVGLGYIKLGQPSATLSGGESQRMKLASELSKKDTGKTMYILDEPTTGLHFEDIRVLLQSLQLLVDRGNTVIVIEHNLDVIKCADYIIDIGPEGGRNGGTLVFEGTPEELCNVETSQTAPYVKEELHRSYNGYQS
ncbi:excinuclease ABC subunit UvrA [Falsiporphyromonas endometrii]|uniref:UvrABC system protein A n=1 Tax=Falsiporphyromonas endometrii TaxID=1387297 RepID=A0ABV9K9K3_9PORP